MNRKHGKKIISAVILTAAFTAIFLAAQGKSGDTQIQSDLQKPDSQEQLGGKIASVTPEKKKSDELKRKLTDYAWAYIDVVKDYEEQHPYSTCSYELIYFDEDDIPELAAGVNEYYLSLFMFDQGEVFTLMDDWPYGIKGNPGYEYLPGQNAMRYYYTEQAGAFRYEEYLTVWSTPDGDSTHMLSFCYEDNLYIKFFNDENHNGQLDEGEDYDGEHFFYGREEITAKEYDAYQIHGDYVYIRGSKTAEEMIDELLLHKKDLDVALQADSAKSNLEEKCFNLQIL